jgi:cytochrome b561
MALIAAIRPDSWNWALFLHIGGAMALVSSLIIALYAIRIARTRGDQPAAQFAFRVLWRFTLPSYLVMRIFAQVIADKEKLSDSDDAWIGIGYATTEPGLLLLLVAILLTGLMARRAKAGTSVAGSGQLMAARVLTGILLVVYIVAIWAMTTKPV